MNDSDKDARENQIPAVEEVDVEVAAAPADSDEFKFKDHKVGAKSRRKKAAVRSAQKTPDTGSDDDLDDHEDDAQSVLTEGEEDPLAPAYDLDDGELMDDVPVGGGTLPWRSQVKSAKEFFNTEILYRYDILEPEIQRALKGSYRIDLKGPEGGVWSIQLDTEANVVNRQEDAETVMSMVQGDFLDLVNGELNPQIAILAQKMKITGNFEKGVAFQNLLVRAPE